MPRAKISDAYGLTVELDANEASAGQLGDKALELYRQAVAITDQRPTGSAGGVQAERRGERTMGFGVRYSQAPVPYQHHEGGD